MVVNIEISANAEVAALVEKYAGDRRLMECAVSALGNVLSTHDRALLKPSDQFDIVAEIRRQTALTIDTLVAACTDSANKGAERTSAVVACIEGMRHDAGAERDRVVHSIAESGSALVRDVGAVVRACAEDVVPIAVANGIRDHARTDTADMGARFERVQTGIDAMGASVLSTVGARADALQSSIGSVLSNVSATQTDTQELRRRIDGDVARDASSSFKGKDGESRLATLLRSRLLRCDGWLVEDVHAQAHSCDLLVKRDGYAAIRIECKRKKQITKGDVDKFHKDLGVTGDNGIFISLEGAVAPGHTQGFSFERIHTEMGMRWAGFVVTGLCTQSTTVTDPDLLDLHQIMSAINIIQSFALLTDERDRSDVLGDGAGEGGTENGHRSVRISGDDMEILKDEIKFATDTVQCARNHLKASLADTKAAIACLDKVTLKQIKAALAGEVDLKAKGQVADGGGGGDGDGDGDGKGGPSRAGVCRYCAKPFVLAHQLAKHEKDVCKKKP